MLPKQILPLPTHTTAQLRSNVVVPSLACVLVELIQNSLDSNATTISISLDLERWNIKCEDNGAGFEQSGLETVGKRYWTSKLNENLALDQVETYGFRGEALASLADIAGLEILTKSKTSDESYSLILKEGVIKYFGAGKTRRGAIGTTVWCRDIFYKCPVRRRPASTPTGRLQLINQLKYSVSILALLHPLVSFSLSDSSSLNQNRLISVGKMREGILGRWKQLWGRAGVEKVIEFDEMEGVYSASGFFSLTASYSKANQHVYVNSRPLSTCSLHRSINSLFSQSSFSRHSSSNITDSTTVSKTGTVASRKSPRKTAEYPIFVFNLKLSPALIDFTLEPEKRLIEFQDEERVHAFVELIVRRFLIAQGFIPAPSVPVISGSVVENTLSPSSTRMGLERFLLQDTSKDDNGVADTPLVKKRVIDRSTEIRIFPENTSRTSTPPEDELMPISWTDPTTLQSFLIDPRTGNSWRPTDRFERSVNEGESIYGLPNRSQSGLVDRTPLKRKTLDSETEIGEVVPEWLVDSLAKFVNPVFQSAPKPIPTLVIDTSHSATLPTATCYSSHHNVNSTISLSRKQTSTISTFFTSSKIAGTAQSNQTGSDVKFTKADLRKAEFIAQVDRKFLLVKIKSSVGVEVKHEGIETLVMIDQHAASERIRVNGFLKEIAEKVIDGEQVKIKKLDPPALVLISREEFNQLGHELEEFSRWGIDITLPTIDTSNTMDQDYNQIYLHSIPSTISERLSTEKSLQQELIRSHLAKLSAQSSRISVGVPKKKLEWGSVIKDFPPVLLDLIESKSCRGAIMFNDELSDAQCTKLLSQLADTDFPFQCAHGRPSLVPLLSLPSSTAYTTPTRTIDWSRIK